MDVTTGERKMAFGLVLSTFVLMSLVGVLANVPLGRIPIDLRSSQMNEWTGLEDQRSRSKSLTKPGSSETRAS